MFKNSMRYTFVKTRLSQLHLDLGLHVASLSSVIFDIIMTMFGSDWFVIKEVWQSAWNFV